MTQDHDPLCMSLSHPMGQFTVCDCGTIRIVRADERDSIANAIDALRDTYDDIEWEFRAAYANAAEIARNGDRDA